MTLMRVLALLVLLALPGLAFAQSVDCTVPGVKGVKYFFEPSIDYTYTSDARLIEVPLMPVDPSFIKRCDQSWIFCNLVVDMRAWPASNPASPVALGWDLDGIPRIIVAATPPAPGAQFAQSVTWGISAAGAGAAGIHTIKVITKTQVPGDRVEIDRSTAGLECFEEMLPAPQANNMAVPSGVIVTKP